MLIIMFNLLLLSIFVDLLIVIIDNNLFYLFAGCPRFCRQCPVLGHRYLNTKTSGRRLEPLQTF